MTKPYVPWLKLAVVLGILYLLSQVTQIFLPLILATTLAFILNPVVDFFVAKSLWPTKWKIGRGFAVLLTFLITAIVFVVMSVFVLLPVAHEFNKFIINLPALIAKTQNLTELLQSRLNTIYTVSNVSGIFDQAMTSAASFSVDLMRRIANAIFGAASRVVDLVIVPVLTYYFLKDWRSLKDTIVLMFPESNRVKARIVIRDMGVVISGYIRGQVIISAIMGFIVFCGMYAFNIDYPLVLGLVAGLTETIPIIGPIVGAIPALLLAYFVSPVLAVKVLGFYLILHQLENHIIVPNVMGHVIDLHPVIVIISLLIGGHLLGIAGMMLAVPCVALAKVLMKYLWITEKDR